tara:strand:- start:179 stop:670 length:492 start_codon:yes stop_codon:yes gene_type:complete
MKNIAIYPGTFDPITYGHIDVIKKGINLFEKLIVAVSDIGIKNHLFSTDERITLVKNSLYKDMKISSKRVQVIKFSSLTTTLCKKYNSNIILRGLRAVSDFEYEFQLAGMNRKLNEKIETIFLMSDVDNQVISSRLVKEIASLNGDLKKFITKSVIKEINKKV